MNLAFGDGEIDSAQDLGALNRHMQALDLEQRSHKRSLSPGVD